MIHTGKGNSGKNQDTVTLVSCEYAHWTLMAQVRPAPGNGGSTSWEIHRCYPKMELSGYLIWTISSIDLGSWTSWQKTLFPKIGSNIFGNLTWSRPCMINLLTSFCLIVWLVACFHFNPCLLFGLTISSLLHSWGWQRVVPRRSPQIFVFDCEVDYEK